MEHCLSGCLNTYLKPHMKPPIRERTIQLCSVLVYPHALGRAHNQLFPCNTLVPKMARKSICGFDGVTPVNVAAMPSLAAPESWTAKS